MSFYRLHRRIAAWLAMWAIALSALAPAVAQAMVAGSDDAQWMEVCSASGMVWLKVEGPAGTAEMANGGDMPMGDMSKHCPWCSFHITGALASPVAGFASPALAMPHVVPVYTERPPLGQLWVIHQARAPPLAF
jgi:hypothetical protein